MHKKNVIYIYYQIDQDYYLYSLQIVRRTTYIQVLHISQLVYECLFTLQLNF